MTKLCRAELDAENKRRGLKYPQVGALTTFTRGFGKPDDLRIAVIVSDQGAVQPLCRANVMALRSYLRWRNGK